ncbi:SUKH-4 family immunity protein [Streptomyces beijiangensis]|uniref:SUKH-4 family immunity protein n=1 Tax=Streptomyces beijiangensis TaxID=163361 RepID=A0A939JKC8_9ACTN|nr:SUKH-4 family immunity protein [Streptomyces beijiangensis]MBO0514549.1 SUKH-4 family immunity protein [Streptomyces beijiangensis]
MVAHSERKALLQGIALAWPEGIPAGGTASDAHYLDLEGVAPESQGEWLAWLHWAAMHRGRREWADRLAGCGVALPWRTRWSRWRPYGSVEASGGTGGTGGPIDYVELGTVDGDPAVAGQHEMAVAHDAEDAGDERYLEQTWRLADGAEISAPAIVDVFLDDDGEVGRTEGSTLQASESDPPRATPPGLRVPRLPKSVRDAEWAGDSLWALGGAGGVCVVEVLEAEENEERPGRWPAPLVGTHRRAADWPLPTSLSARHAPPRAWLEARFGSGALRRLDEASLPEGLTHPGARNSLTDVGFPALDEHRLRFLTTEVLDETGLVESEGQTGPAYLVGRWLGDPVVLEGNSGRVVLASVAETALLGTSLPQFTTLVGLACLVRECRFTSTGEELDSRRSLRAWARGTDAVAADSGPWAAAFGGELDIPESL